MEYGSMFGDGAYRDPDYSAEALHMTALFMSDYYSTSILSQKDTSTFLQHGISERVNKEIKTNTYLAQTILLR